MKVPHPDTLKFVKTITTPAITFAVARPPAPERRFYHPPAAPAFLGGSDFKVTAADVSAAKFEPKELFAHESYVTSLALTGTTLVSGGYDGNLTWFDTAAGKVTRTHHAHSKWVRRVVASPDGKLVASVADDMACKLWAAADGKLVRELRGHKALTPHNFGSMLYALAFSPDGALLATGDKVGHVVVWDVVTGAELASVEAPVMYTWDKVQRLHSIGGVRSLAFTPDGKLLAVGGTGKIGNIDHLEAKSRIEVFDWKAGKQVAEFVGDKSQGLVNKLAFAPDGSWLLGAGGAGEGFFVFYDVKAKKALRYEKLPMHVHDFVLSAGCDAITAVGHNRITLHRLG